MEPKGDVTQILAQLCAGNEEARDDLISLVYTQLHTLAENYMRRQSPGHTLQATALVHEAYLKLGGDRDANWESRVHFLRAAAQAMRNILVDHERRRKSKKRGGQLQREPLISTAGFIDSDPPNLIDLDRALTDLAQIDNQTAQVVELRFFGGLSVDQTARALEVSQSTVKREWRIAKAWLKNELFSTE